MYYILSLKHSKPSEPYLSWWRPNDQGYTFYLAVAGKYTEAQIKDKQWYYNNGEATLAIPCDVIDKLSIPAKKGWKKDLVVSRQRLKKLISKHRGL